MVKLEVFKTEQCPHCPAAIELAKEVANEFGNRVELKVTNVSRNPSKAAQMGIFAVPAIAIDGKVEFVGVPSRDELVKNVKEKVLREEVKKRAKEREGK